MFANFSSLVSPPVPRVWGQALATHWHCTGESVYVYMLPMLRITNIYILAITVYIQALNVPSTPTLVRESGILIAPHEVRLE